MTLPTSDRPVALVTGVGRTVGIGAGIARQLAASGWDIAFTYWTAYDERMTWGVQSGATEEITKELTSVGAAAVPIEADLVDPEAPERIFTAAEERLGGVTALVMCHTESVNSGILDTTIESFDRHFAVNARATWLLIREYGRRFKGAPGTGRIIALTSDHTSAISRTARARARWTGSPWPRPRNWPTSASARTWSTPDRSTPAG